MKFEVLVIDGDVFINGEFVAQLCFDSYAVGNAIAEWIESKHISIRNLGLIRVECKDE